MGASTERLDKPMGVRFRPDIKDWLEEERRRTGMPINRLINDVMARHIKWAEGMKRRDAA